LIGFEQYFTAIFDTNARATLPLEVVDQENFTAEFYHLKLEIAIIQFVHAFDPQIN